MPRSVAPIDRIAAETQERLAVLEAGHHDNDPSALRLDKRSKALRLAVVDHKRATMLRLREEGVIDEPSCSSRPPTTDAVMLGFMRMTVRADHCVRVASVAIVVTEHSRRSGS